MPSKSSLIPKTMTSFKYTIEDDIDFYSELNKSEDCEEEVLSDDYKRCLITGKILEQNSITLDCKHSFNYISLFKEVSRQSELVDYTKCW